MEYFELPVSAIPTDDRDRKSALTPVILDGAHVPFNLAAVLHDLNRIRELAGFCVVVFGTGRLFAVGQDPLSQSSNQAKLSET